MGLCASTNLNNNVVLVKTNLNWLHLYWWAKKQYQKITQQQLNQQQWNQMDLLLNTSMYWNNKEVLVKLKITDYKSKLTSFLLMGKKQYQKTRFNGFSLVWQPSFLPQVDKKVFVFEKQIFRKYFFKNGEPR